MLKCRRAGRGQRPRLPGPPLPSSLPPRVDAHSPAAASAGWTEQKGVGGGRERVSDSSASLRPLPQALSGPEIAVPACSPPLPWAAWGQLPGGEQRGPSRSQRLRPQRLPVALKEGDPGSQLQPQHLCAEGTTSPLPTQPWPLSDSKAAPPAPCVDAPKDSDPYRVGRAGGRDGARVSVGLPGQWQGEEWGW